MKTGVIIRLNERRSCMLAPHSSMSTACAGPRDARQDFQVSLAHSVRAGATIPGLAPLARASAARRSSGARFRRAPDARPPWLYGAMAWLLRPPGRAYLVLLAIGASHLPWLAASDADVFPMTGLQRLNSRASMFQCRFGQQGATE